MIRGRSTCWRCLSSSSSAACPLIVSGTFSIVRLVLKRGTRPPFPTPSLINENFPEASQFLVEARASGEVVLERPNLEIAAQIGLYALGRRDRPCKSGIVGHLMQEGGLAQGAGIRQGAGTLGGVEDELDIAVLDRVHHMRTSLQNLVDTARLDAVFHQEPLGSRGGDDAETAFLQRLDGRQDAGLVLVPHRYEHHPGLGDVRSGAELALGESDAEAAIEADHFA